MQKKGEFVMRTSNPFMSEKTFRGVIETQEKMTLGGTIGKTFVLFLILLGSALFIWLKFDNGVGIQNMTMIALIGGGIAALITIFVPKISPITAPVYATFKGLVIGGVSAHYEMRFPGIVIQVASLTLGVMFVLLVLYSMRLIKATDNFKLMVVSATGAIFVVYLINFILNIAFHTSVPYLHSNGWIGIGIGLFVVSIAALNLVLDFDFIENRAKRGAPKYMEWYSAFGLIVTLVWLYIEMLRLLAKFRSRD
jgi:uncharacterized YccA/Bax inhibitor family protein